MSTVKYPNVNEYIPVSNGINLINLDDESDKLVLVNCGETLKKMENLKLLAHYEIVKKKIAEMNSRDNFTQLHELLLMYPQVDINQILSSDFAYKKPFFEKIIAKKHFISFDFFIHLFQRGCEIPENYNDTLINDLINNLIDILNEMNNSLMISNDQIKKNFDKFVSIFDTYFKVQYERYTKSERLIKFIINLLQLLHSKYIYGFEIQFIRNIFDKYLTNEKLSKMMDLDKTVFIFRIIDVLPTVTFTKKYTDQYVWYEIPILYEFLFDDNFSFKEIFISNFKKNNKSCYLFTLKYVQDDKLIQVVKFLNKYMDAKDYLVQDQYKNTALHYLISRIFVLREYKSFLNTIKTERDPSVTLKNEFVKQVCQFLVEKNVDFSVKNRDDKLASDYINAEILQYLCDN